MGDFVRSLEGIMSIPDYLLEEPDCFCTCGNEKPDLALYCNECMSDNEDMYADEKIQDRLEGRNK